MKDPIWKKDIIKNKVNGDNLKDFTADVLIMGGGIAGINTAFYLNDSNLDICLIESNEIASGTTSLTTAKITYLQDTIYSDLKSMHNYDVSKEYLDSQLYAIDLIDQTIKENNIECDYTKNESYIFSYKEEDKTKIDDEYNILKEMNVDVKKVNKLPSIFNNIYGIMVKDTYIFNPIKYINSLVKKLNQKVKILERVRALSITKDDNKYIVKTNKNTIKAKYVVVCSLSIFYYTRFNTF